MNGREIAEVIAEFLIDAKDTVIPLMMENDKEILQDEIFNELTEI